jgi:hypothetical protein
MNWNLVGSIYGRLSLTNAHFVMIHYQTWPPQAILVSDWPIFLNLLLWNLPDQINRNLVGSIYGMSSMKIAHFVLIGYQTWSPQAILVSDWSISKKSSPLKLPSQINRNLVGSIYMYGRLCIKFPQSRMKGERDRLKSL